MAQKRNVVADIGASLTRWSLKYMPDPGIFAVVLTLVAFLLGVGLAGQTPLQMVLHWYQGFWSLLAFSMQMALIIITGSCVAGAPLVRKFITRIAKWPASGAQAAGFITFVSVLVSFLHWGLTLIVSALLAKEIARELRRKRIPFEYGLLAAAAYVGQMTWHGMTSASIGLLIATPGHFLEKEIGVVPMSAYMFNTMNIAVAVLLLFLPAIFAYVMHPSEERICALSPEVVEVIDAEPSAPETTPPNASVGDFLNHSRVPAGALALMGGVYIWHHFGTKGFSLDINVVNFIFLMVGILLHGNIANYRRAVNASVGAVSGIIFQFPLYAGIMGMVRYSGLVDVLAGAMVSISNQTTFYVMTFLSAAVVNLFIPSGGGQWTVQGPIVIKSALLMDADVVKTCLAVAYGNSWMNMFQPFWAIALLGITGLKARDIIGYSTAIMLLSGPIFILCLLFL